MKWQPIETAPHGDGIYCGPYVLIGGGEFWDESETFVTRHPLDRTVTAYHDPLQGWVMGRSETHCDHIVADPTHWMPLPEAPK